MILTPDTIETGAIVLYAGTNAPTGWLLCHGQTIHRQHFPALCKRLPEGSEAGTHVLPDLRGRLAVGAGTGSGLSARTPGESGGSERHTLAGGEIPEHDHQIQVSSTGSVAVPAQHFFGSAPPDRTTNQPPDTPFHDSTDTTTAPATLTATGGGAGHNNLMPFTVLNFIIKT